MMMDIDVQWGGYYASRDENDEDYTVFRILDFNKDAYHAAIFKEKFTELPDREAIESLTPFVGHAPIDSKALVGKGALSLIYGRELNEDDLIGYRYYLEQFEVEKEEIEELMTTLVGFSKEPPMKLRLGIVEGELTIEERK